MRAAGSPGTCGANYRAARGDPLNAPSPSPGPATAYGCQTALDSLTEADTAASTALPAQRTRPRVTDGGTVTQTVDVDGTTEVAR